MRFLALFGEILINLLFALRLSFEEIGRALVLFGRTLYWLVRPPFRFLEVFRQLDFVGVQSVALICVTGAFTGMALALQSHIALEKYGAGSLLGAGVSLGLCRELGPVLSALMVVARVGSAMTAELGSMRNTDQIDALAGMAVEPVQYLVVPRLIAATIVLPLLAILYESSGMIGANFVAITQLGMESGTFMASVREYLELDDILHGLIKSVVFGAIIAIVGCSKGFYATGGARGVGTATTRSVVVSSLLILGSNYVMTAMMFRPAS